MRRRVVVAVAFAIVATAFTIAGQEPAIPVTLAPIIDLKGAFASPVSTTRTSTSTVREGRRRPADLLTARVRLTIAGGRVVFSAN